MTRRYRVTVLTSSPLGCVRWMIDPTLPRDGTDLIATGMRGGGSSIRCYRVTK
jgi:hypothetical protein